eukprot:7027027-Alexandrium_andersonii.AAC.1
MSAPAPAQLYMNAKATYAPQTKDTVSLGSGGLQLPVREERHPDPVCACVNHGARRTNRRGVPRLGG